VALFASIDTDSDGLVDPADVRAFVDSIEHTMTTPALEKLDQQHPASMDLQEFQRWLIDLTSSHPEYQHGYVNMQNQYDNLPSIGERSQKKKPAYAWNQSTMSQSLRRMQYAVRGEVVIQADKLAAQGRRIIYTNIGT
jgi:hypothetical protein